LDLKRSLQLHRRLALTIAAVGLVLGLIFYFSKAPVYTAQCLVYVQPAPPNVIQQGFASRWPYDSTTYDSYIQQQIGNAMREDVLTNALNKLGDAARKPNESDEDALNGLRRQLSVARVGQTYQFFIEARASNPELAAQTANVVAASYIESTAHDQRAGDQQRLTMLREERDRVQSALDADRAEQQELNKQLGVASVAGAPDHFDQDISEIRTELVKARTEHDAAEAKFAAMGANHGSTSNAIGAAADESADMDAGLVSMKTALNARRAFLISKMANLTPGNPEYKQDAAELAQINANVDQMMKDLSNRAASHIQLQLRSDLERTAGVEAQLNGQLRQLVLSATNSTPKLQRASDLAADITRLQSRYSAVDEQLHNLMLEDAAPSGAYISTPADVPNHRSKSGKTRNALAIVMLGLFLGLLAAVARHKLDKHVYIGSDVQSILGFSPMAMLPDFDEVSEGAAEEHLLRLAAAIEHANKQGHLKNCVFTGAGSGVGVTTIVTRVRTLLEAMGRPTVYVDASGTSIQDESAAAGGPLATQALVKAGAIRGQSTLTHQMANDGDDQTLVLTDAAPIAVSAETEYLARFADCAIVIIESGVTTRAEIRDAAATLQRLNVGAVGFVLNRVGLAKADPAFRASVDAIEKHLQSQMGAVARRTRTNAAVVTANAPLSTPRPAELSPSISFSNSQPASVIHQQVQAASAQAASPDSTSPNAACPDATSHDLASPQLTTHPFAAPIEPSWRVTSGEPLFSTSWMQDQSPAAAPAVSSPAQPVETRPSASILQTQPPNLFEPIKSDPIKLDPVNSDPINRQESTLPNQPEPDSLPTIAAPVVAHSAYRPLPPGEPLHKVEQIAEPFHGTHESQAAPSQPRSLDVPTSPAFSERPAFPTSPVPLGPIVPVVQQSMWAQRERLSVPAQPEIPRGDESKTVAYTPVSTEKPVPEPDPDIPWWLSDVPGQLPDQPTPIVWQEQKTAKLRKEAFPFASPPVEAPRRAEPASLTAPDESPERLTSRLSGLRSLLAGLGLKEVHSSAGAHDPENAHRAPLDRWNGTAEDSSRGLQSSASSSLPQGQPAAPASHPNSAQPEFLKPATTEAEYQVGDSKLGEKSLVRTFQLDTENEEPTLPSRRGQYRNL
jgi:uncharacterized protein involved in exopolysaccharide biosynthesis